MDVVAVHRRDERLVEPLDDGVRDLVPQVLDALHARGMRSGIRTVPDDRREQARALPRPLRVLLEQNSAALLEGRRRDQNPLRAPLVATTARALPQPSLRLQSCAT